MAMVKNVKHSGKVHPDQIESGEPHGATFESSSTHAPTFKRGQDTKQSGKVPVNGVVGESPKGGVTFEGNKSHINFPGKPSSERNNKVIAETSGQGEYKPEKNRLKSDDEGPMGTGYPLNREYEKSGKGDSKKHGYKS